MNAKKFCFGEIPLPTKQQGEDTPAVRPRELHTGFTHDLKKRLEEHNSKKEFSTKTYAPFELIHYEAYQNEKDAKRREVYFKTTKGKTTLKTMLKEYFIIKTENHLRKQVGNVFEASCAKP